MGIFDFSKGNVSPEEWINAAKSRNIEEMKLLLKKGADVNAVGKDGFTALMAVSLNGHIEVVKFLLDNGADVDATNDGWTALNYALLMSHTEVVKFLLDRGANTNG